MTERLTPGTEDYVSRLERAVVVLGSAIPQKIWHDLVPEEVRVTLREAASRQPNDILVQVYEAGIHNPRSSQRGRD